MRKLTVKRNKTFVGCAAKLKICIEDSENPTLSINGVPCKILDTIKNGEEKTFEIDSHSRKLFVIADKFSKGFCNEFYPLPEGDEDISLCGKCHFSLATGNAFRFDGVTDPEVLENRKKNSKKGISLLIIAAIVGFVIGVIIGFSGII